MLNTIRNNCLKILLSFQHQISAKMSSTKCQVAICQFTATNNKSENLIVIKKLVAEAAEKNAKMIFLPESSDYLAEDKCEVKRLAEPLNGPIMNEYKNIAVLYNVWLSVGGFHEKIDEDTIYNSHVLIDNSGEIKSIYRKIHLFNVAIPEKNIFLRESDVTTSGSQIYPPVDTPAGPLALAICYDLRFPELSTLQTNLGANILTYPSAFTHSTGKAHWEILLRARAIENQCYVIAAAQYGKHNDKRISYGQSMIIDPWGRIKAECAKYREGVNKDESIAIAEIDLDILAKLRTEMPLMEHRRNDIYNLNLAQNEKVDINDNQKYNFADKIIPCSTVFYRSKYCYAFTNIRCVVPGHVLIAPLRTVPRLSYLTKDEIADLFQSVVAVQRVMEMEHDANSSTVCVQDGPFAGQTVPHVHVHILPRKNGDFTRNDDVYLHLAKHDRDENPQPLRPVDEMSEEARKLRLYFV